MSKKILSLTLLKAPLQPPYCVKAGPNTDYRNTGHYSKILIKPVLWKVLKELVPK